MAENQISQPSLASTFIIQSNIINSRGNSNCFISLIAVLSFNIKWWVHNNNPNEIIKANINIYMFFIYIYDSNEEKHLHWEHTQVKMERKDVSQVLTITFWRTWLFTKYENVNRTESTNMKKKQGTKCLCFSKNLTKNKVILSLLYL